MLRDLIKSTCSLLLLSSLFAINVARADEIVMLATGFNYGCNVTLNPDAVVVKQSPTKPLKQSNLNRTIVLAERKYRNNVAIYERQLSRKTLSTRSRAKYTSLRDKAASILQGLRVLKVQSDRCYAGLLSTSPQAPVPTPTQAPAPAPQPLPTSGALPPSAPVAVCGNGVIESGENCDDGNLQNGDCCSSICKLDASGTSCGGTAPSFCAAKSCNASGACVLAREGAACSDGNECTLVDICLAGQCKGFDGGAPTTSKSCGVGACSRTVTACSATEPVCTPGNPSVEVCNDIDDDCDGTKDEGLPTVSCGIGACAQTVSSCVGGRTQACTPLAPQVELCNGLDDNCDGIIDNGNNALCTGVVPHGTRSTCQGVRGCAIVCAQGFANLDGNSENGCEVDLSSDPKNCGGIGKACPTERDYNSCATPTGCNNGVCTAAARREGAICTRVRDACLMDGSRYYFAAGMQECNGLGVCGQLKECPEGKTCREPFGRCF
jgi:cysteine-rich repeat protein